MARPSRSAMYSDDATFLWKAILRSLAILLAIVGIGTTAWAMISHTKGPTPDTDSSYYLDDVDDEYSFGTTVYLPWQYITLGLSILWNIANISILLARNRAIHPGANVACDLLLWLGLLVTGGFANVGAINYLYYTPDEGDTYDDGSPYGGGSYSNGTQYQYTANGTIAPTTNGSAVAATNECAGFATCAAQDQYVNAMHHKGVVIAVGASMAFVVLLFHFALFISACRYTNNRRGSVPNRQSRAITAEATEIARKMIADMTGPNGGFIPITQTQQGGNYQQLQQSEAGEAMELRQRQSRTQPGYYYQPVQQGEVEEGEDQRLSRGQENQRQNEQMAPGSPTAESSSAAVRRSNLRVVNRADEEIHPALRNDPDAISHAM